jgi:hypothetical protein
MVVGEVICRWWVVVEVVITVVSMYNVSAKMSRDRPNQQPARIFPAIGSVRRYSSF